MTDQAAANKFMTLIEARINDIVDARLRAKTGVRAGGPYNSVWVDLQGRVTAGTGSMLVRARKTGTTDITLTSPYHMTFDTVYYDPYSLVVAGPPWNVTVPHDGWYTSYATVMVDLQPSAGDVASLRLPSLRSIVDDADSDGWCMWQTPIASLSGNETFFLMAGVWTGLYTAGQTIGVAVYNDFSGNVFLIDGDVAQASSFALQQWA